MHTISDLDLDVFSWPIVYWPQRDVRPSDGEHSIVSAADVRHFLEVHCGLSTSRRLLGQEVTDHDQAFFVWKTWIEQSKLTPPFSVIHVDAHADMGMGDAGWVYLLSELLALPVDDRCDPRRGQDAMNAGNYLMFAVANRWLSDLMYVFPWQSPWTFNWRSGYSDEMQDNPGYDGAPGDLMVMHFQDGDWRTRTLELRHCTREVLNRCVGRAVLEPLIHLEPAIPFEFTPIRQFNFNAFTHLTVAQSPLFAPKAADKLLPVIREYFVSDRRN